MFEERYNRISKQADRLNNVITDIRRLCEEQGITIPQLDSAIKEANDIAIYKAKLDRYMKEIQSERTSNEEKLAIIGVMVQLAVPVSRIDPSSIGEK